MPDETNVTQPPALAVSTPSVAPRRRRTTRARPTIADVLARRREIEALLATPAAPARRGEPSAVTAAAALVRKFPLLSLRAEKLYLRLCGNLPADGKARTYPLWRLQAWAGECSARTTRALVRELTIGGVLPLVEHRPGRQGRAGSYRFIKDPFRALAQQHRERQGIIDRREKLRATRIRLRAEGSTAAACQRISFNANWMIRRSCTASEMDALNAAFPVPATRTAFMALPYLTASQLRARWGDWSSLAWERWTPSKFDRAGVTVSVRREPPLIGSGQSFADAKAAALAHLQQLRGAL